MVNSAKKSMVMCLSKFNNNNNNNIAFFSQASWGRLEMKPERNKFKIAKTIWSSLKEQFVQDSGAFYISHATNSCNLDDMPLMSTTLTLFVRCVHRHHLSCNKLM